MKLIWNGMLCAALCLPAACALADDLFTGITCHDDIATRLRGRLSKNERVAITEKAHQELRLKNSGGVEGDDPHAPFFVEYWQICGDEYALLSRLAQKPAGAGYRIEDALRFGPHSKSEPQYPLGDCESDKGPLHNVLAVLKNVPDLRLLPVLRAWRVDTSAMKFVPVPPEGVRCPRDAIASTDGGL